MNQYTVYVDVCGQLTKVTRWAKDESEAEKLTMQAIEILRVDKAQ